MNQARLCRKKAAQRGLASSQKPGRQQGKRKKKSHRVARSHGQARPSCARQPARTTQRRHQRAPIGSGQRKAVIGRSTWRSGDRRAVQRGEQALRRQRIAPRRAVIARRVELMKLAEQRGQREGCTGKVMHMGMRNIGWRHVSDIGIGHMVLEGLISRKQEPGRLVAVVSMDHPPRHRRQHHDGQHQQQHPPHHREMASMQSADGSKGRHGNSACGVRTKQASHHEKLQRVAMAIIP
ncbi:hypothetical protein R2APBS1_1752 [Rhodanobacter denitrificans]|uniref:Uncharacterized protein n=1 Tax=Rhodanobacter denitrificans TaxID=666685 RepID=M4NFP9_9GAMM|nr:hypothetical protein R2APBS1_1752 [Rhodanobacter denitrificans]